MDGHEVMVRAALAIAAALTARSTPARPVARSNVAMAGTALAPGRAEA